MNELKLCPFCECPAGMFEFRGNLFLKSEYGSDAYCISSGELFWGGTHNSMDRDALEVHPIDYDEISGAWNRRAHPTNSRFSNCHIWEPGDKLDTISDKCEVLIKAADIKVLLAQPANEPLTWVPVSDRLPGTQQRVLVRCDIIGTTVGWIMYGKWVTDLGDLVGPVTHWMPLPEYPKTRPPERSTL